MYKNITSVRYSRSSSMDNAFGDSVASGPGNLQMAKKVVVTKGKYKTYMDEMRQSYELGFTPFRLHTNTVGTYVSPIRVYDGQVYVLDDVATLEVGEWYIEADKISGKLIYFVKGDGVAALLCKEIEDTLELEV